jgi:hypothetical protein
MLFWVLNNVQNFVSDENDIIIPKSVRPIVEYEDTRLGESNGAERQFRVGNLHIREYNQYYTAHIDRIDPNKDAFGHLIVDAPQYVIAILAAVSIGRHVSSVVYNDKMSNHNKKGSPFSNEPLTGWIAGSIAGSICYIASNIVKGIIKRTECIKYI